MADVNEKAIRMKCFTYQRIDNGIVGNEIETSYHAESKVPGWQSAQKGIAQLIAKAERQADRVFESNSSILKPRIRNDVLVSLLLMGGRGGIGL